MSMYGENELGYKVFVPKMRRSCSCLSQENLRPVGNEGGDPLFEMQVPRTQGWNLHR